MLFFSIKTLAIYLEHSQVFFAAYNKEEIAGEEFTGNTPWSSGGHKIAALTRQVFLEGYWGGEIVQ